MAPDYRPTQTSSFYDPYPNGYVYYVPAVVTTACTCVTFSYDHRPHPVEEGLARALSLFKKRCAAFAASRNLVALYLVPEASRPEPSPPPVRRHHFMVHRARMVRREFRHRPAMSAQT